MDNLGAIAGPLLALALVALVGTRTAIALSVVPGLLAALAIVYPTGPSECSSSASGNVCLVEECPGRPAPISARRRIEST